VVHAYSQFRSLQHVGIASVNVQRGTLLALDFVARHRAVAAAAAAPSSAASSAATMSVQAIAANERFALPLFASRWALLWRRRQQRHSALAAVAGATASASCVTREELELNTDLVVGARAMAALFPGVASLASPASSWRIRWSKRNSATDSVAAETAQPAAAVAVLAEAIRICSSFNYLVHVARDASSSLPVVFLVYKSSATTADELLGLLHATYLRARLARSPDANLEADSTLLQEAAEWTVAYGSAFLAELEQHVWSTQHAHVEEQGFARLMIK
jgi:hypothetical protein